MQNKKSILIWVLLLLIVQNVVAQKYFEKSISWEKWHEGHKILEQSNGNFIIAGSSSNGLMWHAYTVLLQNNGDSYQVNNYLFDNYYNGCNVTEFIKIGNKYIISGYINDTIATTDLYYLQLSENGIIQDSLFIGSDTTINLSTALCLTFDGGYFVGGSINIQGGNVQPYIVKIDSNNQVQEEIIYGQYAEQYINLFTDIHQARNQNCYYVVGKYKASNYVGKILLAKLDTNGVVVRDTLYSFYERDIPLELDELDDGGFLIVGASLTDDNIRHGLIFRVNPDWTVAWQTKDYFYDGEAGACFIDTCGNYIIAGSRENIYTVPFNYDGEIVKLNPDGSLRWQRILGGTDDDYIYDAIYSSDGSIVLCGRTASNVENGGANLWVLKLNCMGLLTLPQASFVTQIDTGALRASFYNTSQFVYPDSIDGGHYLWQFGDGSTSTELNPTHTYAQGSNYTVTLTAVVCVDTSVFVQEVSTWAVGVMPIKYTPNFGTFIPNPSSGTTTLQYNLVDDANTAILQIYDLNGYCVTSATLKNSGNYVLDATTLHTGIYMYTISVQGNIVERSKLAIIK